MSDLFILDDNDISPEYRREVEKMRRKVSQRDVVVYQELRKRLLKKEEPPAAKAAEIIRIDNKAVISDTKLTPVQRKMLQLTELAIQGRARHLAQRAGWSTADLGNPKKTGSPDWLRFNIAAMDDLGLTDSLVIIFHTEVEIYNVITKTVGLPFIDCLTNIVGLVANSVTSPVLSTFQQILGSVANDQGVTDSAKKLLNDVFESAEQEDKNHLFDLAPAWLMGNEEMLATVYAVSASDIKDSDWKTFLLSIVGKGNTFYSAAIGIKFADELWELLGWEKLLVDVITKKDRNYEKKIGEFGNIKVARYTSLSDALTGLLGRARTRADRISPANSESAFYEEHIVKLAENYCIAAADQCLVYAKDLDKEERSMVQLTLAYISKRASIRFEYAYGEKVGDNPENQVKLIYFNIVNDIISKLGHVTKNYVAAESIIDKKYKSKINLMDIVAVDAYKKLFGTTDPVMTAIFRDFIEKLPYKNRQSVINISNIFWRQRTSKIGEGMFCDISSAVRNESGDIQIAYIMCYSSEDLIEQDILFLDYYYNNVYVKMNGFGLIMQKDKWVAEKQKIIDQLKHDMVKVESIELGDDELGVIA